jgi:hypothetical protein
VVSVKGSCGHGRSARSCVDRRGGRRPGPAGVGRRPGSGRCGVRSRSADGRPLLRQPGWLGRRRFVARLLGPASLPRAFPDDKADLLDGRVGADLRRRLGITYDPPGWAHAVSFDTVKSPPFPRGSRRGGPPPSLGRTGCPAAGNPVTEGDGRRVTSAHGGRHERMSVQFRHC